MTAHIEAAPDAEPVPPAHLVRHPAIFFPLFVPFGLSAGYVSVTLGFQLAAAGLSTGLIATLVALSIWPQTWKMLWAPVVDTIGNPKLWYGVGAAGVGGTILAMSLMPATARQLPALSLLVVASSVASTLVSMASEVFMAHSVPPVAQGRASGWAQAGNFGGSGIGGGLGLFLAQHVHTLWVSPAGQACCSCRLRPVCSGRPATSTASSACRVTSGPPALRALAISRSSSCCCQSHREAPQGCGPQLPANSTPEQIWSRW